MEERSFFIRLLEWQTRFSMLSYLCEEAKHLVFVFTYTYAEAKNGVFRFTYTYAEAKNGVFTFAYMYAEAKTEFFYSSYVSKEPSQIVFEVSQAVLEHKNIESVSLHIAISIERVLYLRY